MTAYIASKMDVATGHRKILKTVPNSIQAPNWTRDGKHLIYNSSAGLLYKYDLSTGAVSELNCSSADTVCDRAQEKVGLDGCSRLMDNCSTAHRERGTGRSDVKCSKRGAG